jgi:transposase, IS5 family
MLSKKKLSHQVELFNSLAEQLNQKHPLYKLANEINWLVFDQAFSKHYCSDNGRPAKPIRLMVSLFILKHLRNLSDESVVEQWAENNYYQYFSGEFKFIADTPCVPTELVMFRDRIGSEGMELILKESIRINDDQTPMNKDDLTVSIDTTVQEKNITYPSDDKQYKKIIKHCWKIADAEAIVLRRSYSRKVKSLSVQQRFRNNKNGRKAARKADRKIRTIAGALVRELGRKLSWDGLCRHIKKLKLYERVIQQQREHTDKIYSLHEPTVKCYTKGKAHKKYEFGSKASIVIEQETGIIIGAQNFNETIHDSKTLPQVIDQCEALIGARLKEAYVDRGYRGISQYNECEIKVPKPVANISTQQRQSHSRRSAIEPVIGHLKAHYRLGRNFYKGMIGDDINLLLAAAAMNFKRVMNLWSTEAIIRWLLAIKSILQLWKIYVQNSKIGFLRVNYLIKLNLFSNMPPTRGTGFSCSFTALIIPKIQSTSIARLANDKMVARDGTIMAITLIIMLITIPRMPTPKDCFKW